MLNIKVKIKGVKPFLFHKFNIESLTDSRKPKEGTTGNSIYEWRSSFFHKGNQLYMPSSYVFACLKNGAVNTKVGRGTIQKTFISAATVDDEEIYFNRSMFDNWEEMDIEDVPKDSSMPVYIDIRMVSNPNTKGKNVRYRVAMSPGWECSFSLTVDDSLISASQMKKIVEDAGKLQGIADGRTLGYGRFDLIEFESKKI